MKKNYILPCLAIASMGFFAFQATNVDNGIVKNFTKSHFFSGGGQSGLTGAPGEANCTQCHSGTTVDGATQNVFSLLDSGLSPVTSYIPGASYTASIQLVSNPGKRGFSSVALDGTDTNAGSFTGSGIGGTQDFSAGGRDYVSHTVTSNTDATTFWAWSWIAPATSVGDVTFYVASNETNNNGSTSGDVIYLSTHVITDANASISETTNETSFTAGFNTTSNKVMIDFTYLAAGDMYFNLVDMNGRSVFTYDLGQSEIGENTESITLPSDIKEGMYVVHFFIGNKAMSANIMVKR
ncbi:MAG: hypothetical protein ACI865_000529 [Flavobacteriaceae bacterium]|jgi:hypothetical protein